MLRRERPGRRAAGFSLVEVMVVVVILGIVSAIAIPRFRRDTRFRACKDFASTVARDLQRARVQAVSERLPVRAFIYSDRVELRMARAGATPGAPPIAPTTAEPILRMVQMPTEVQIWSVLTSSAAPPPAATLTTATPVQVEFNVIGQAQYVGQAVLTSAFIYLRHTGLPAGHLDRDRRVDINALTGFVGLREAWQ